MKRSRSSRIRQAIFLVTGLGLIAFSAYTTWALFGLSYAFGHEKHFLSIYAFCAGLAVIGAWCIRVAYAYRRYERLLVAILATSCVIAALVCIVAPSRGIDIQLR
jgi:hypothetical protein